MYGIFGGRDGEEKGFVDGEEDKKKFKERPKATGTSTIEDQFWLPILNPKIIV
jgi:hypothetical protein